MAITTYKTKRISTLTQKVLSIRPLMLFTGLIVAYLMIAIVFACFYCWLGEVRSGGNALGPNSFWEFLHYSLTTQGTVGYGDYYPIGLSRWLAALQALIGIVVNSVITGVVIFRIIKREAHILFPEYCCYDPEKNTFAFEFFNADADDLVQVSASLSLGRMLSNEEDQFIRRKGYGIELDFFEDAYTRSGLLTAIRSLSDEKGVKANKGKLNAKNNIISPLQLREKDDALIFSVSGTYRTSGSVVYDRKEYPYEKIKCGIYKDAEQPDDLENFEVTSTSDATCKACPFHDECELDVARRLKNNPVFLEHKESRLKVGERRYKAGDKSKIAMVLLVGAVITVWNIIVNAIRKIK